MRQAHVFEEHRDLSWARQIQGRIFIAHMAKICDRKPLAKICDRKPSTKSSHTGSRIISALVLSSVSIEEGAYKASVNLSRQFHRLELGGDGITPAYR